MKIQELKKALEQVKGQIAELERICKVEREKYMRESNDKRESQGKLEDCNKIIHEQNAELQKIRKLLDEAKQDMDLLLVCYLR